MEKISPERAKEMKEALNEVQLNMDGKSLVQNNKFLFVYKNKHYHCRMPNQREQSQAEQAQNKYKIRLIQEEDTLTRKQLIKVLKEKQNIDIKTLECEKEKLQKELQTVYLELAIVPTDDPEKIEQVKQKKKVVEEKFMEITIEIVEMLAPSIEEQAKIHYFKYLSYLCTEEQVEDKDEFKPIWQTYEEFENNDTGLSFKAVEAIQTLLLSI